MKIKFSPKLVDMWLERELRANPNMTDNELKLLFNKADDLYIRHCGFSLMDAHVRILTVRMNLTIKEIDEMLGRDR